LRIASGALFLIIVYQLFWSKKGSQRHQFFGKVARVLGVILAIVITIRGLANGEKFTFMYGVHLVLGFFFLFFLFKTIQLGIKVANKQVHLTDLHKRYAWATLLSIVTTIGVGIFSFLSHS
jgi:uncharacterized membrane protein